MPWPIASFSGGNLSLIMLKAIGKIDMPIPIITLAAIRVRKLVVKAPIKKPNIIKNAVFLEKQVSIKSALITLLPEKKSCSAMLLLVNSIGKLQTNKNPKDIIK